MRDGAIEAVGPAEPLSRDHPGTEVIHLPGRILAPGFVDAHCHTEWALLAPPGPASSFAGWLGDFLPRRARMDEDDHAIAAGAAALAATLAGTTTLADSGPTGAGAAALAAAGLRGIVHLETFGAETGAAAREKAAATGERVARLSELSGPLVEAGLSPHAPYTVGPDYWDALARVPGLAERPWSTHLAESRDELRLMRQGDGPLAEVYQPMGFTPARWDGAAEEGTVARLARAGALRPGLVAAHCVEVDRSEVAALASGGVAAVHCPSSNRALGGGRMPLDGLRAAGVAVALGTDSPASGGRYDVRAEARAAGVLHAGALDAADLLRMATLEGARALGLGAEIGSLTPGKRADLVALAAPGQVDEPAAAALGAAASVDLVMVDGRVVLEDGEPRLLDPEGTLTRAAGAQRRLC